MITVACVRVGNKYGREYVVNLKGMVDKYLREPHEFICFTDLPQGIPGVRDVLIGFPGWWAKMNLFRSELRGQSRCIYFDLDTLILRDLEPLANCTATFGICANFTRLAGHSTWPCRYGSAVMTFAPGWGDYVWEEFSSKSAAYMANYRRGDQQVIEKLVPNATILHNVVPEGFFASYRDLTSKRSKATVVCFGGKKNPDNSHFGWVMEAWNAK